MTVNVQVQAMEEIERCKDDFYYFANTYLKILDKNSKFIPLKFNTVQIKLLLEIEKNPWQLVLKARQLGSSTLVAALFFWKTLFTPNERTLVVAHTSSGVSNIFRIYQNFYDNLPKFLQFITKNASAHEMIFFHGGTIRVSSATGQSFRGATYNNLHCSEVAFWKDMSLTIAGLFQTAGTDPCIILETTANGLNQFHALWTEENSDYGKTFLAWTDEPSYAIEKDVDVPSCIEEYASQWGLTRQQTNWAAQTYSLKCASSFVTFQQEYAIDEMTCFVSSGARFFDEVYPHIQFKPGYIEFEEPMKYITYVLGVDTASGSPNGDYSAFSVLDVTNEECPRIVASYAGYNTPIEFGEIVLDECKKWDCLAVVENNSYGLTVIEVLKNAEWGKIYTQQRYDTIGKVWSEKLGFNTSGKTRQMLLSKLQSFVNSKKLILTDDRAKHQANTFVYDASGKPDHISGKHDDILFSIGLALMGVDQAIAEVYQEKRKAPKNLTEIIKIEVKTGTTIKKLKASGYFTDDDENDEDDSLIEYVPWD